MRRNERISSDRSYEWKSKMNPNVHDARLKIIIRQNSKVRDARDRLNLIAKRTDARQRLLKLKAKKANLANQRPSASMSLTRTISNAKYQFQNKSAKFQQPKVPFGHLASGISLNQGKPIPGRNQIKNRLGGDFIRKYHNFNAFNRNMSSNQMRKVSGTHRLTITAANDDLKDFEVEQNDEDDLEHSTLDELPNVNQLKNSLMTTKMFPSSVKLNSNISSRLSPLEDTSSCQGYKVIVTNLHSGVTHDDIQELFGEVGLLISTSLSKNGAAEVVFFELTDALKACEVYNNRQLDGKPMHVKLTTANTIDKQTTVPLHYEDNAITRQKISPDVDIIRRALFHTTTSNMSQQPSFTITMSKH